MTITENRLADPAHRRDANLASVYSDGMRKLRRASAAIFKRIAKFDEATATLARRESKADEAESNADEAREQKQRSNHLDAEGPGMLFTALGVLLLITMLLLADFTTDAGAFEVLRLSGSQTRNLAWLAALVSAIWADITGKAQRRVALHRDPVRVARADVRIARLGVPLGFAIVLGIAILRYVYTGSLISLVLFTALGMAAFLAVRHGAYLHHSAASTRARWATMRAWLFRRLADGANGRAIRAGSRYASQVVSYRSDVGRHLVNPAELVIAQWKEDRDRLGFGVAAFERPTWLVWAQGIVEGAELRPEMRPRALDATSVERPASGTPGERGEW